MSSVEEEQIPSRPPYVGMGVALLLLAGVLYFPLLSILKDVIGAVFMPTANVFSVIGEAGGQSVIWFVGSGTLLASICLFVRKKTDAQFRAGVLGTIFGVFFVVMSMFGYSKSVFAMFGDKNIHELTTEEIKAVASASAQSQYPSSYAIDVLGLVNGATVFRSTRANCLRAQREFWASPEYQERYVLLVDNQRSTAKTPVKCSVWSSHSLALAYTPKYAPDGLIAILDAQP